MSTTPSASVSSTTSSLVSARAGETSHKPELDGRSRVIPGHIAALDGLRAFAIIAVIFHHCGEYYLLPAHPHALALRAVIERLGSGVDLFFALSGFLITGILLDSEGKTYFFKRFYWRRGLRIWPLYYAFILAVLIVHSKVFSGLGFAPFALYYRNFLVPIALPISISGSSGVSVLKSSSI